MRRLGSSETLVLATLLFSWAVLVVSSVPAVAEDKPIAASAEKSAAATPAKTDAGATAPAAPVQKSGRSTGKAKQPTVRLPNYYKDVVSEEQAEKIRAMQREYAAKIDPLRRQLETLTKERDAKIEAVLTPEQKKEIENLKATAKVNRDAKKATKGSATTSKAGGAKKNAVPTEKAASAK